MLLKLKIGLILLALSYNISSYGQVNFNINIATGVDTVMDIGFMPLELSNGKFLACGITFGGSSNYDAAYIVKTEVNGDIIWKKHFDFAPTGGDFFKDVKELPDNNYLILGMTYDSIIQNTDVFLAKIDTNGNLLWFNKYTHTDNDQSSELEITPDNKIIILGNSSPDPNTTYNDILLIKTDLDTLRGKKPFKKKIMLR